MITAFFSGTTALIFPSQFHSSASLVVLMGRGAGGWLGGETFKMSSFSLILLLAYPIKSGQIFSDSS